MMSRARSLILAAALFLAPGFSATPACAQETGAAYAARALPGLPAEVVDGACREGALMLYRLVYRDDLRELIGAFRAHFPCVAVTAYAAPTGALTQRFTSEFEAGNHVADLWMSSSPSYLDTAAFRATFGP